eukprot:7855276-Pyramimonas_sp.AAC.1
MVQDAPPLSSPKETCTRPSDAEGRGSTSAHQDWCPARVWQRPPCARLANIPWRGGRRRRDPAKKEQLLRLPRRGLLY